MKLAAKESWYLGLRCKTPRLQFTNGQERLRRLITFNEDFAWKCIVDSLVRLRAPVEANFNCVAADQL